tara:strand:+ start:143 stop:571 length:429 start_codon:yes stop_codon:yes gene_type:complete
MKKVLFLFCLVNAINTFAQDILEIDDRLLFRFTQSQLDDIASKNPSQIKYLNFYLNNSYYFQDTGIIPDQKLVDYQDVFQHLSLPLGYQLQEPISQDNFNILMFNVPFFENKSTAYLFGNSNLLLVLRSKKTINEIFNENNY